MLPIFMTEDINYAVEGVLSAAPCYKRTLVVCDGEALIGKAGKEVRWDLEIQKRLLMGKLITAIGECGPRGALTDRDVEEMAVLPIAMPPNEKGPGAWKALLVNLPNQGGYIEVRQNQEFSEPFRERCEAYAAKWQNNTGTECGVLTGHSQFEQVEEFFLENIGKAQKHFGQGLFKKTGNVICATQLMSLDLRKILQQTEPALANSLLRQNTQVVDPNERASQGPRL